MTSSLGWIDFSSEHCEKMRSVIDFLSAPPDSQLVDHSLKRKVHALVLADGQDATFQSALRAGSSIEFHEIRAIARKLKLIS